MADKLMAFYHAFQSAAVATGTGTAMDVGGLPAVGVQITGISGDTITFQGTIDDTNWVAVQVVNLNDGSVGTTATANGLYLVPVTGLNQLRCNITIWGAGTITVLGKGVVTTAGVGLADIDIVGAEAATIADGADVAQGTTTDAAAASDAAETTTARTGIGLWKGIKNILVLLNAKFVSGTDIGDVTINNAADAGVYTRPGTSATFPVSLATAPALVAAPGVDIGDVGVKSYTTIACGELIGVASATQLPSVACKMVNIKACNDNAGNVYIGGSGVTVANGATDATTGLQLDAGEETGWLTVSNLNVFYRICDNVGDDCTYLALS